MKHKFKVGQKVIYKADRGTINTRNFVITKITGRTEPRYDFSYEYMTTEDGKKTWSSIAYPNGPEHWFEAHKTILELINEIEI